jgi:hypothetical protein
MKCNKEILILVLFIASMQSFILSCKKNQDKNKLPLFGKWNWVSTRLGVPLGPNNPQTPANTGNQEQLIFSPDYTWKKVLNNTPVDSGTYSLGHGVRELQPFYRYEYDSIKYYRQGIEIFTPDYFYCANDSLIINPGLAGAFSCYSLPFNGVKIFLKN